MKSARITIEGENIRKITDVLTRKENICYQYDTKDVVILAGEEYYMRIKSNLMYMYILNFKDERIVEIEIIAGGGIESWDIGLGAENSENKKMAHSIMEICQQNTWSIIEITPADFKEALGKSKTQQSAHSDFRWFEK
jgi:hypothetical protein